MVLTTGRGSLDSHLPVGEAMDRAGQLLRQLESLPDSSSPVLLDEVTAGLLGPGFQLTRSPSGPSCCMASTWAPTSPAPCWASPPPVWAASRSWPCST